jgi:hypothetical protein
MKKELSMIFIEYPYFKSTASGLRMSPMGIFVCVQFTQKEEEVNKILAALQKQMEDYQVTLDQRRLLLSSLQFSVDM